MREQWRDCEGAQMGQCGEKLLTHVLHAHGGLAGFVEHQLTYQFARGPMVPTGRLL